MKFNKDIWNLTEFENWLNSSEENLKKFGLKEKTLIILKEGFPEDAAPFLSFYSKDGFLKLESVSDLFGINEKMFSELIGFGFDGCGNPICIDRKFNERIIILDHEDNFEQIFVNSDIENFAYSLLAYRNLIADVNNRLGDKSFSNYQYSSDDVENFKEKLNCIDSKSQEKNSFWYGEIETLIANKNAYS
jgi:hypothetical protein